jgi:hypothetical protein
MSKILGFKFTSPFSIGERITGTNLHRRFMNDGEVCPVYKGESSTEKVIQQAEETGWSSVFSEEDGCTYAKINGAWYKWYQDEWIISPVEMNGG